MDKKKFARVMARAGTGFVAFAGTLVGGYVLTPNKTRTIDLSIVDNGEGGNSSLPDHFQQFVTKITEDVGMNEDQKPDRVPTYFKANLENFAISYQVENSSRNHEININGDLDFMMNGLNDINFNLDADVDYNGRDLNLEIGYFNKVAYFGLKDLRIKCSQVSLDEIKSTIGEFFYAADKLDLDVDGILDEFSSKATEKLDELLDINKLMTMFSSDDPEEGTSFNIVEEQNGNNWDFTVEIEMKKRDAESNEIKTTNIDIVITTDADYNLRCVDLGTIDLGSVTIGGKIRFDYDIAENFVTPENRHPEKNYNYVEIFKYSGWIEKLADFLSEDKQKFGISFSADLDNVENSVSTDIAKINGSINVDFDELIDLSQYKNKHEEENEEPAIQALNRRGLTGNEQIDGIIDEVKEKVGFNLQLDLLGQEDINYANLALTFVDGEGYFNFNESDDGNGNKSSVMKFKLDTETMNWLVNELPGVISDLSGETSSSSLTSLFSFITDSEVVSEIKEGNYAVILDMIDTLKNTETTIELGLDLSLLGLGDDARVDLVLDSENNETSKVLTLDVNNLKFGDYYLNLNVISDEYHGTVVGDFSTYDSLSFVPDVVEQVSKIVKEKKAGFTIDGSVLDDEGLGLKIYGALQFNNDPAVKDGFGSLTIDQYKYHSNKVWYSHKLAMEVNNLDENKSNDNAWFIYGDPNSDNIKGKVTIQSVLDMVDVIKTFVKDSGDDPKFHKFLAPITKLLGVNALTEIIEAKNYVRFAGNDFVKKIAQFENGKGLEIVVGGSLIGLDSDIKVRINFKSDNTGEDRRIDSLEIIDLVFSGKKINFNIGLTDYDDNKVSPINTNAQFMDLSSISVLLELGINTTKLNYYHLTANANVNTLLGVVNIDISDINVYIYVDGEHVKIYGKLGSVPLIVAVSEDYQLFANKDMYSEFTFETYDENDPNREDGVGGYFHIKRTVVKHNLFSSDSYTRYHYKATSKYFLDNIVQYLLGDLIGIKSSLIEQIGNISSSEGEKEPGKFTNLFTDTGFKYSVSGSGNNTVKRFDIGVNLNEVAGIDALRTLELTLKSKRIDGTDYLHKLDAALTVKALVNINVSLNATVANLGSSETWSVAESAFNAINNVSFPANYVNSRNYLSK